MCFSFRHMEETLSWNAYIPQPAQTFWQVPKTVVFPIDFSAMFIAIFVILLGVNGIRNQDFPLQKRVEEMEMKFEKFEAKTLETMEMLKTHIQNLETYGQSVEKTAAKLAEDYNKMSSEEKEAFLQSFAEQCQSPEAGCSERAEYFAKAFKDPCQGDGCKNGETVGYATKRNICKTQKLKFVQWTQVMCSKMHNLEPKKSMGGCLKKGIDLLFATTSNVRAQEFAKAPPGKSNLVLWTRVSANLRKTLLRQIPKGFILTETMLGAVASQPGVEDFQGCAWGSVKQMWASNSASLIQEMEGGSKVYFVSGIDLLQESKRPFGKTVAFSLELPQLGQAASNVRQAVIVNLHNGTKVDHLYAAVRAALSSEADAFFFLQNDLWLLTCLVSKILWIVVVHKFLCSSVVQGLYPCRIACQFSFQRLAFAGSGLWSKYIVEEGGLQSLHSTVT